MGDSELLPSLGGLAVSAFFAATFLPGTTEAVLAGLVIGTDIEVWLLVTVASVFNVAGSGVNYGIGRFLDRFRHSRFMPVAPATLARGRRWFERYGVWSLLLCWLPVVGDAFPVVAGFMRVPVLVAFPLIAVGKTLRFVAIAWGITAGWSVVA